MTYNKVRTCRLPCLFLASVILSSISLAQDLSGRVINATGTHTFQTQQLNFTTANAEIYRWTANVVVVDNLNKPANQSIPFSNDRYIAVGNLSGKNISITDPSKITRDVCAIAFSPFAQYTTQELDYNDGNGGCSKPLGSNCLASIEKAIKGAAVVTSNGTLDCENLAQSVASTLNLDNIRKDCKWFGTDGGFATYPQRITPNATALRSGNASLNLEFEMFSSINNQTEVSLERVYDYAASSVMSWFFLAGPEYGSQGSTTDMKFQSICVKPDITVAGSRSVPGTSLAGQLKVFSGWSWVLAGCVVIVGSLL